MGRLSHLMVIILALIGSFFLTLLFPHIETSPSGIFLPLTSAKRSPIAATDVQLIESGGRIAGHTYLGSIAIQYHPQSFSLEYYSSERVLQYARELAAAHGVSVLYIKEFGHTSDFGPRAMRKYILQASAYQ